MKTLQPALLLISPDKRGPKDEIQGKFLMLVDKNILPPYPIINMPLLLIIWEVL